MLTRQEALSWFEFKEPWELHCLNVASLSEKIANHIKGVDSQYAFVYGLVHDIGRITERGKSEPKSHPVEGYNYLMERGYKEEAMSCITHTFPSLKDITLVPGMCHPEWAPNKNIEEFQYDEIDTFIRAKLRDYTPSIYDTIVLISDLMSAGKETVAIRERLDKVYEKYGDKPNRKQVYEQIDKRKCEVEARIFPHKTIEEIVGL